MSEQQITITEVISSPLESLESEEPIIHLTENGVVGFEVLCRLCANRSDHLIPIYSEEGISNDLADKMNLYLPVKVAKTDVLPLQCCFQCATTVLTWHELVVASVEADKRLRDVQAEVEKQLAQEDQQIETDKAGPSKDVPEYEKIFIEEDSKARKTFECPECKKLFHQKLSLQRHQRIHRNERPYTCDICGMGFRDKSGLNRHISHVHFRTKLFQCSECAQRFASAATRDDHQRTHTKQRPFVCQACGKRFSSKAGLYIHGKIHSDVFPFSCGCCGKKFRRRQELTAHQSTHSGEKPHACPQCGKSFRIKTSLNAHLLIHKDDKPFCCAVCGSSYKLAKYLKNHVKAKHSSVLMI